MNMHFLEHNLCDTCKVNRVFDVCDREHGMCDKVAGCPNYIPTDFYYRDGTSWAKIDDGSTYRIIRMRNEDIAKSVKDCDMENQLIECATKKGLLSKEMYDCLYGIIKEYISNSETASFSRRKRPNEYEKCLHENVNICIGKFFSYIQRMEDNGIINWEIFTKKLKSNYSLMPAQGKDIVVTYQDGNIQITQDLIFDDKGVVTCNNKSITFKHGWTSYACSKDEKDREECVIKVFRNQVDSIEMGSADWITSIRRYTLMFKNKKKMYFDMY